MKAKTLNFYKSSQTHTKMNKYLAKYLKKIYIYATAKPTEELLQTATKLPSSQNPRSPVVLQHNSIKDTQEEHQRNKL